MGSAGGRSYLAAGMFLFATLGFIVVQLDRQRKQRTQQVTGSRTEYLRYLANVRQVAREAADQQRRALTWHHPAPAALPGDRRGAVPRLGARARRPRLPAGAVRRVRAAARARARAAGERADRPGRPRLGVRAAPAARRAPAPATAAGERRPARLRPGRGLRRRGAGPGGGPGADLLGRDLPLPRAPRRRGALQRPQPGPLGLAEVAVRTPRARRRSDAVGPSRMVTTSLADLAALLPPDLGDRPRFGADERPATPHILLVIDGGEPPARQPRRAARRPARRHAARPPHALGRARRPEPAAARAGARRRVPAPERPARSYRWWRCACARSRSARSPTSATSRPPRRSPGGSPRCTPRRRARRRPARSPAPATSWTCSASATCTASSRPPRGAHARRATGCGCRSARRGRLAGAPRHQGVGAAGHGPARSGDRRDRLGQVGVPAHAGARPGDDALVRAAQHGARRLQGRRDLRRDDRRAPRLGGDHQPRAGADARRPHAGRAVGRDGAAPGAAARGGQLRLRARLREGPGQREPLEPLPSLFIVVDEFSEMLSAKPEFIDLFVAIGRLGRSLGLHLLLASQRLEEGRLRGLESHPVLPRGPAHLQRRRVPIGARCARRL